MQKRTNSWKLCNYIQQLKRIILFYSFNLYRHEYDFLPSNVNSAIHRRSLTNTTASKRTIVAENPSDCKSYTLLRYQNHWPHPCKAINTPSCMVNCDGDGSRLSCYDKIIVCGICCPVVNILPGHSLHINLLKFTPWSLIPNFVLI